MGYTILKGVVTVAKAAETKATAKDKNKGLSRIGLSDLISEIYQNQGEDIRKKDVDSIVRTTISTIKGLLSVHTIIALPDLFILKPVFRDARMAHNPQKPGEKIEVPAGWSLKVKPSPSLKEEMN